MKITKKFTVSSEQTSYYGKTSWSVWSYANSEVEYNEYVADIESLGFRARVVDRETKKVIYITK